MTSALMSSLHADRSKPCHMKVLPKTGRPVEFTKSVADLLIPYLDLLFNAPGTNYIVI